MTKVCATEMAQMNHHSQTFDNFVQDIQQKMKAKQVNIEQECKQMNANFNKSIQNDIAFLKEKMEEVHQIRQQYQSKMDTAEKQIQDTVAKLDTIIMETLRDVQAKWNKKLVAMNKLEVQLYEVQIKRAKRFAKFEITEQRWKMLLRQNAMLISVFASTKTENFRVLLFRFLW